MRKDELWIIRNGALVPVINRPVLLPASQYINFGAISGTSGYGVRDNGGVIEFKNSAGAWTPIGTGVPPAGTYTPGSVLFGAADGSIGQDNPTFFWDNTNKRLGIGINTPQAAIHLYENGGVGASPAIIMGGNSGGDTDFWIGRISDNDGANNDYFRIGTGVVPGTNPYITLGPTGLLGLNTLVPTSDIHLQKTALGVTVSDAAGFMLQNTTAAALGAQQISPGVTLGGYGWATTGSTSQQVEFRSYVLPAQGSTAPTGSYIIASSIAGAAYTTQLNLSSGGTLTITGNVSLNGTLQTSTTAANSNLYVLSGTGSLNSTSGQFITNGSTGINMRTGFYGSTSTTLTVGNNYASVVVGSAILTEAASGNHPMVANLAVKGLGTITGGVATVGDTASLYIDGIATATVTGKNWALYSRTGENYFGGAITNAALTNGLVKSTSGLLSNAAAGTDYQAPITLTTTGTSGAATLIANTLNIPQYQAAGTYVTSVSGTAARISSTGGTTPVLDLITTAVTPGSYTAANITVDAYGRITAAANGAGGGAVSSVSNADGTLTISPTTGAVVASRAAITGDITISAGSNTSAIAAGVIVDADVNASAAIALTKLAATTANRALVSNASGFIIAATTTDTEIGYVNGVTSAIQTQLNGKQATGSYITALTGDATAAGPGSVGITLATVNSNVGTFGSATQAGVFTVNAKGLITAASNVTITPAVGSITGFGTGVATALAVNVGSAGAFVTFDGALGTPSSGTLTNATGLPLVAGTTGTLTETRGGTNQTSYTSGDILYASAANTLSKRAIGSTGDVLTVAGGVPTWAAPTGAAINYQPFTASGTWTKPSGLTGNEMVYIIAWGAGGGGGSATTGNFSAGGGGGGGACVVSVYRLSDMGATETITIGTGGAAATVGGNTTVGTKVTAYGGGAGATSTAGDFYSGGGGGGGSLSAGNNSTTTGGNAAGGAGGGPLPGTNASSSAGGDSNFGGGSGGGVSTNGAGSFAGGRAMYGGGGGGGAKQTSTSGAGGNSYYGGGGGSGGVTSGSAGAAGTSVMAGAGGAGGSAANGSNGVAPAGGGGGAGRAAAGSLTGGSGARGEVRIWVLAS